MKSNRKWWVLAGGASAVLVGSLFTSSGCTTTGGKDTPTNTKTPRPPTSTPMPTNTPAFPTATPWYTPAGGYVVAFGGNAAGATSYLDTLVAPVQSGGALGAWVVGPNSMPSNVGTSIDISSAMWAVKWVQPTPWVIYGNPSEPAGTQYSFYNLLASAPAAGSSVGTGPWIEGTPMADAAGTPVFTTWAAAVTDNTYVYTVEGTGSTGCGVSGQITGGTINSWTFSSNCTGVDLNNFPMIVGNGYVFTLGGRNSTAIIADIYRAPITSPGTFGAWSSVGQLPQPLRRAPQQCIAVPVPGKILVYYAGGFDNTSTLTTVFKNEIDAFGNLGTWTTATSLPGPREYGNLVAYQNAGNYYVAIIGGRDGAAELSSVYYAPITVATGALGSWTSTSAIPSPRQMMGAVVF